MITAHIVRQRLNLCDSHVVADTIDYLEAKFIFKTDDWNGLDKWVHFSKDSIVYDIRLTDDCIRKEDHLNLSAGMWKVYLHGNEFRNGEVVQRITTDEAVLYVSPTGILDGEPFPTVPPSAGEQIIASAQAAEAGAKVAADRAAASERETKNAQEAVAADRADVTKTAEEIRRLGSDAEAAAGRAAKSAEDAEQARLATADIKAAAEKSIDEKTAAALSEIDNAGSDAVEAVENEASEGAETLNAITRGGLQSLVNAADTQIGNVNSAGQSAVKGVADAKTAAVQEVQQAGSGEVARVNTAGAESVKAVQNEGENQRKSIAEKAEEIVTAAGQAASDIQNAGETAVGDITAAGNAQVQAVEAAGQAKLDEIAAQRLGAVLYDTAQELTDIQRMQGRDNTRSAGEIVESASGEVIALDDASDGRLRGLVVYGKSTQDGTPTPDAPVEIVSVGGDGEISAVVAGKNVFGGMLFAERIAANNPEAVIDTDAGTVVFNLAKNVSKMLCTTFKAGVQYTFVIYGRTDSVAIEPTGANLRITYTDGSTKDLFFDTYSTELMVLFTTPAGRSVSSFALVWWGGKTTLYYDRCGIFEGVVTAEEFEPYTAQTLPISTPDGLCGIPVTSGGNYTDADGQMWVCDEVDFVRGVRVQRINRIVYMGEESFWTKEGKPYFFRTISNAGYQGSSINLLCSCFERSLDKTYMGLGNACYFQSKELRLFSENHETPKEFMEWLAENPMEIIYILAEPIETPLTESELAAYAALHTNKPNTTIYADDNAGLAVDYVADTKLYIDKKFDALAAAIVGTT